MTYLLRLLFISLLSPLSLFAKEVSVNEFKSVPILNQSHIKILKAYHHDGIYELVLSVATPQGSDVRSAFVTENKKVVLFGNAMQGTTGNSLSIPVKIDVAKVKKNADLVFGHGKKEYIVFTDPECPYCVRFEQAWPQMQDKVTMYVYFMPLSFHKKATKMIYHIMNEKDNTAKIRATLNMANGDNSYEKLLVTQDMQIGFGKKITENKLFANELKLGGTPAVFDMQGRPVKINDMLK